MKPSQPTLFLCAVQFLTRLPTPNLDGFDPVWINRSARYFSIVGQIVGGLSAGVLILAANVWPGVVPVILAIAAGIAVTGALHEDGLADAADGLGGGRDRVQRLAIMKDSRLGVYGALAAGLCLALKIALLSTVTMERAAILLVTIHGLGRAAAAVAMHVLPYARTAETAKVDISAAPVTFGECAAAVILALWPMLFLGAGPVLAGIIAGGLFAVMMGLAAKRLIGGQTGDILGAMEQLTEIGFLLGVTAIS